MAEKHAGVSSFAAWILMATTLAFLASVRKSWGFGGKHPPGDLPRLARNSNQHGFG